MQFWEIGLGVLGGVKSVFLFVQLNFQLMDNERVTKLTFVKRFNFDIGNNILLNRMHALNGKIGKS